MLAGREHDDPRLDRNATVEIDDVLVEHPDAAGGDVGADGLWFGGPMDAVERIARALEEVERPLMPLPGR